ncbi:MAG: DUF4290 domain-containing protein [Bacteroides sp.]|nr:DUF4290 domain-containing protein [Bacteroides sp.]MCM1448518.1 DUF4290 domain-containing protein [Bacteroides sp.]
MSKIQYNTEKPHLTMPEYGRAIHDMVAHCLTIADRQERQACAQKIVYVMANLEQERLVNPETQAKLWNHLALLSNFRLDIDYPVEILTQSETCTHPSPMPLPQKRILHKHYGHIVEEALNILTKMPDGEKRNTLVCQTADRMRQNLFTWTPDTMSEEKVRHDIETYAPGCNLGEALKNHQYAGLHTLPTNILKKKRRRLL